MLIIPYVSPKIQMKTVNVRTLRVSGRASKTPRKVVGARKFMHNNVYHNFILLIYNLLFCKIVFFYLFSCPVAIKSGVIINLLLDS